MAAVDFSFLESSAWSLQYALEQVGLGSLATTVWNWWKAGRPLEQIMLDVRLTPEYKSRFPAMDYLAKTGHAMSEAEYIGYEQGAISIFRAAGLPPGFYDNPDDFADFLRAGVALPELQDRVNIAKVAVYNAPPELLTALEDFYGIGGRPESLVGDLTAYFLDETRALPLIQQQFLAAQDAAAAARTSYGGLSRTEAERLASLGVTPEQAQQGFGALAGMSEFFGNLAGEEGMAPTRQQGQEAVFEGNREAVAALERRSGARKAEFGAKGGYLSSDRGFVGIT